MKIDRLSVYNKCGGRCGYCGREITIKDMQVDHITPKAWQGGTDEPSNLMPTCRGCNHYKRCSNLEDFRASMMTLHERIQSIYINKVAINFKMFEIKPFDGVFYFEKTKQ